MALVSSGLGWGRQWVQAARGFWGESSQTWLQLASRAGPWGLSVTTQLLLGFPARVSCLLAADGPRTLPPGEGGEPKGRKTPVNPPSLSSRRGACIHAESPPWASPCPPACLVTLVLADLWRGTCGPSAPEAQAWADQPDV